MNESIGNATIVVVRENGTNGIIAVRWRTIDKSATNGKDYFGGEGIVKFGNGEVDISSPKNLCTILIICIGIWKSILKTLSIIFKTEP